MTTPHSERHPLPPGSGRPEAHALGNPFAAVRRVAAMAAVLFSLAACWGLPGESRSPGGEQVLQNNLSVASAALAAGQPAVAQRLYLALAERFEDAPEPALGLGYVALQGNNPGEARDRFLRAASLADDAPGMRAEALLGAARASLALGDSRTARGHLIRARDLARDPSTVAWIENGLAVAAVFEEDYRTARTHYESALRQPSAHPRIAANYVRMLVASEQTDDAARTFAAHAPSWWEESDRQALRTLIEEARRSRPVPDRLDTRLLLRLSEIEPLPAGTAERAGGGVRPAVHGVRSDSSRLVLLVGDMALPLQGLRTTATSDAAPADGISSERGPEEGAYPVPSSPGTAPESSIPIRAPDPARDLPPGPKTAEPELVRPATRTSSSPPNWHESLALRIGPATASEGTPDAVEETAAGSHAAPPAEAGVMPGANALLVIGDLRLLSVAETSRGPASRGVAATSGSIAAPAPVEGTLDAEAAPAAGSPVATGETWAHYLGPDPAQAASALFPSAAFRYDPGPHLAYSELPSSPVSLGPKPVAATAKADGTRRLAAAPASDLQSTTLENEGRNGPGRGSAPVESAASSPDVLLLPRDATRAAPGAGLDAVTASGTAPLRIAGEFRPLRWDTGPAPMESVAAPSDYENHDPFSASPASYRPILLASASPHLDDYLWQSERMQAGKATHSRHTTMVAVDAADDPLAQMADAGTGAPAPGGEWSVLLGTGQRLSLEAAAAAVAVAAPEIADVQLLSPRVLFVMGRNLGRTTLSVLGEDGSVFERDVAVVLDLEPLRQLLSGEPGLQGVRVGGLARGVSLAGDVGSQEAADRALRLAAASLPQGVPIENNLDIGLDLSPLRALLAEEPGLAGVEVRRIGRSVALTGEVASAEAADRAHRLAVASLPADVSVENNLRVVFDLEPLRAVLAAEPGLEGVEVKRLTRGVALGGEVDSPEAADRALGLATASLPDGLLVENNLNVELDLLPLRAALAGEPGLHRVHARRLARGVALTGEVDTPEMADRALRMAAASLPEGVLVESNLELQLDLSPLNTSIAGEPGLEGVEVRREGRGVALTGEVASIEAADRARRLAAASLPDGTPVEDNLQLALDAAPLRAALENEPGLGRVQVQRLARSVVLSGDVDSPEAESRTLRLAAASLPEGVPVESELDVGPDLEPLRALLAGEPGLAEVELQRVDRGVALTGEVTSAEAAGRAHRLAVASLPETSLVENNLRVVFDIEPLVAVLAKESGLGEVQVTRLARGVALAGEVDSPAAADRAFRLATASLPDGLLVENNLDVELDLLPLRALLAGEPGLEKVGVKRVGRGVVLTGETGSAEAADRARRLAVASLPESVPVEDSLQVALDVEPLRDLLAREPGLDRLHVERLARGVALSGDVDSPEAADRALRLAAASLPEGLPVENDLNVGLNLESLQALMAGETGLGKVRVQRIGRGVALTGEVDSAETAERAVDLVAASLLGAVPLENRLRVEFDVAPLRTLLAQDPDLGRVRVRRLARGVALTGEVDSPEAVDRAIRLAAASLPAGAPVENGLRVLFDLEPLRAVLAGESGLDRVQVQRLARGVALAGEVDSPAAADLALRLAAASLPEGLLVEDNLNVGLDLEPVRALMAGDPDLGDVQVRRVGRGVVLTGEVASAESVDRAVRLAAAPLPEDLPVENNLRVVFDIEPLRAALAGEPGLQRVQVQRLARGVALAGEVDTPEMADRAVRVARASLPQGLPVENNLGLKLDLMPLIALFENEPGLWDVKVQRDGLGAALSGEVASLEAAERAHRLAADALPEGSPVANHLRIVFDVAPLRALLAGEPGLDRVQVAKLARSVALSGEVASPAAESHALTLAAASLPEDIPVENNLKVGHDLDSLRALLAGEPGLEDVEVRRVERGVALTGEVASAEAADRARRLAVASLPDTALVENNLRVVFDIESLRAVLAEERGLGRVQVRRLARGVALAGEVDSPAAADRALRLAAASLPEGLLVDSSLDVGLDLAPLHAMLAGEPDLGDVQVQRIGRGVALTGEVASAEAADRALRLAAASLPESVLVENNLRVVFDIEPLRSLLSGEPGLHLVHVRRLARGVALTGEVSSPAAADLALRLASASLPEGAVVENNLDVGLDLRPVRALLAGEIAFASVRVQRVGAGVALTGKVASADASDRAYRLAAASLPEGMPVENNLRVAVDLEALRELIADEPGLEGVQVQRMGRGAALTGRVASAEAAERTYRLAVASLPEGTPVGNTLRVEFDIEPLQAALADEPGLERVLVRRLAHGVALAGDVDSPGVADRALGLAAASLPAGLLVENNLTVTLELAPLRALLAREQGLEGVRLQRVGRGVALTGEVAWTEASERSYRLATAALPQGTPVENNLRVRFELAPLRTVLAGEPGLEGVQVRRLARGVALAGEVDSAADADRALRIAAASLPEGLPVENNLSVGLDLGPLRALLAGEPGSQDLSPLGAFMAGQPGLEDVAVQRVGRGVALTGEVASAEAADRAHRLAVTSLPETVPVENNLRVLFDIEPVRAALGAAPGLEQVSVQRLARGVALSGPVDSPEAEDRALRLAAASLPEGLLVENNLAVGLDLAPLRTFMAGEPGLAGVQVQRVGRSVALTGEVASVEAAERSLRLAVGSLPEGLPVENNLRVVFDIEPLRTVLAAEPGLDRVQAKRLARGVALAGEVASADMTDRALRLARASLPEGLLVEDNLSVVWDVEPTRALLAAEPGLEGVLVQRLDRGLALTGEVASEQAAGRAHRLAAASLPEGVPVENNLRVVFDFAALRALLAGEAELARVQVQGLAGGVVLTGEVASAEAAERAQRIASASLPEGVPVENSLRVLPDIEPLRLALAAEPGLERVQVQRLARGVALSGEVDSPVAEDRALRLAAASLPEGVPLENNLNVGLDLGPLRSVVAGDPELAGVRVERTGRGIALIGGVGSAAAAEQASRLAAALLPEGTPVETGLRVVPDIGPLRALLAGAPELDRVEVQQLARGVALTGDVDSHAAADLAFRLATASLPEGLLVESSLNVRLDLAPLRVLLAGDPELRNVRVKRVGGGVALTGEAGSAEASDRAARLATAALPEGIAVENNLRVAPDVEPLRALLAGEPGLERVQVQKLVRGVALAGDVASPEAAGRALRLATASLPEGMLVEDNLTVGLDLAPLRALMAAEVGFEAILVKRVDRGVALTGEVGSQMDSERAARLAAATLPEGALVENNLRTVLDTGPLRAALATDPEFDGVRVRALEHGVSLVGEVSSAAAADRAQRLAAVSLPPGTPVENGLRIGGPLQVNLEVQIAEVQRSIAEEFGFNWELFGRSADGGLGGGFRIGRQLPLPSAVGGVGGPGTIPPTVVDGLTSPSLVLSRTWEEIGITGMVDALAKAGLANVLARPNVTANSGETASFFSGGEFPLPSGFQDGVIVFEYKKYGVVLDFVPTIVDEGRIELTVRPEVSEPSQDNSVQVAGGVTVPVINVRRAETTVAMGDGESVVIAGLFSSASNEVQSGVPVLKDLPLVGGMFGHTSTRADELELIVTVTARLVEAGPAPSEAVAAGSGQTVNSYYY